ncbi:sugar isomerase domain-containing protein [Sutcliffiella halmapala]|uniref:sugar isomerase domain-containing protein n=1 Tax=Sutcliffiella halmapala TaxID=79882 RepID=UPI000995995A|nr:SIS domain-containing protein [Sutcliffiella halmapala]
MHSNYMLEVQQLLKKIELIEDESIEKSATVLAKSFAAGGILHVFGCGHSHMIAEEVFYRAGGVVPVRPILIEDVMLHKGAFRSSAFEKSTSFAHTFLNELDFQENDILLVVSTSGRNPVPIDVALYGKTKGLTVISISSHLYHNLSSRHQSGEMLGETADIAINNHIPQGDALISFSELNTSVGPGSTIANTAIVNSIIVKTVEILTQQEFDVPIFKSGNLDGSEEHNERLVEKYRGRIGLF